SCDMRLAGQAHHIAVPVPAGPLDAGSAAAIAQAFQQTYAGLFKRAAPEVGIEALNWRLSVSGPRPALRLAPPRATPGNGRRQGPRPAYLPEAQAFVEVPVYYRPALVPGDAFAGPAIVEERESTAVIGPGRQVTVDPSLNLIIRRTAAG